MIRSLYVKLLLSAMVVVAALMALLVSLEYDFYRTEQDKEVQHEMQTDLSRLFSTKTAAQEEGRRLPFSALAMDWDDRNVDGIICSIDGSQLWSDLIQPGLVKLSSSLCQQLLPAVGNHDSFFGRLQLAPELSYVVYSLRFTRFFPHHKTPTTFQVILLRPATNIERQNRAYLYSAARRACFIYLGVALLLILSTRWALSSLRQLQRELEAIRNQRQLLLQYSYESELQPLTTSLNQLLENERKQKDRYQHTMNDLAHSLKTRLALIQATMAEEQLSQRARDSLNEQVNKMDQIIQYHLRRAVAGRQLLTGAGIDPVPIVQKLLATMAKVYQHKRLQIRLALQDGTLFHGEQDDLFELLGNLLDNAHKFAISEIAISVRGEHKQLCIQIEDDGPGIDEAMKSKVLQRGVRADNSSGQGIGLCVCSEIVDSYNGRLTIDDSPLGGARFTIVLPGAAV